jgi:tripartite-type tricarboxylate transporter receptor subunit TctC
MAVPAKTPVPVMARLHTWLQHALDDPETRTALDKLGLEPIKNTPEQADQLVLAEIKRWDPIIKRLELKLE